MNELLAFHIGPVQEFIATARRTQDWWIGSFLLAHLSRTAAEASKRAGGLVVLPQVPGHSANPALPDVPNHFLARIPDGGAAAVARTIEEGVKEEWRRIHHNVKDAFFWDVPDSMWTRQLESFLEIYWALVPDDCTTQARNQGQAALDARKRLRDFAAVAPEPGLKCSLCGARQELSGTVTLRQAREWWRKRVHQFDGRLRVRESGGERLCAVCVVKRAALHSGALRPMLDKDDGHFPSTSSVAAAPFKRRLLVSGRGQPELERYFESLEEITVPAQADIHCLPSLCALTANPPTELQSKLLMFDGDMFYAETLTEKQLADEFPGLPERIVKGYAAKTGFAVQEILELEPNCVAEAIRKSLTNLRTLTRAVRRDDPVEDIPPPSKYYAALKMDGDHMGAFFSKATEVDAQALSERLSRFAREQAKEIVERHDGRLVYAGGDDALAFLPLADVLPAARELRRGFRDAAQGEANGAERRFPTPSIGVTIAHHTAPLDGVLLTLQRAERAAKAHYGRDALCIHVLKRSGEEVRVGSHWTYDNLDVVEVLQRVIGAFESGVLAMKFAQNVAAESSALSDHQLLPDEARTAALKRLVSRHCAPGHESQAERLACQLAMWAGGRAPKDADPLGLSEVATWILLARFIASGGRDEE